MRKPLVIVGIFVILIITASINCSAEKIFGLPNDYLQFGAGARSLAMGSAFTGVADDASAAYWNPAGLAFMDEYQLLGMYAPFRMDTSYNYASLAMPFADRGAVAISDVMLVSGGFQGRDDLNLITGSDESVMKQTLSASYAYPFVDRIAAGVRVNFIQEKVFSTTGDTFGLDFSLLSRPWHGVSAGLVVNNINRPKITLVEAPDIYGRNMRLGLTYHGMNDRFLISIDANKLEEQDAYYTFGMEYNPVSLFSFRAGFNQQNAVTAGMGINFDSFRFDYAFSDHEDLGDFNKVSMTLRWGNIYRARIEPLGKTEETGAIFVKGLHNELTFDVTVPRFQVKEWQLAILGSDKTAVRTLSGRSRPPEKLIWDMTDDFERPINRGTYTYVFTIAYEHEKTWTDTGSFILDFTQLDSKKISIKMKGETNIE
ncbi:MAG: PorV/PorQ family protein [Elusimicrobia bacterium]|nr:PorV/PorQ family protein [Elusimicrobiota bacterium]